MKLASQVLSLQGEAYAVDAGGRRRPLRARERIAAGEQIELADGARLRLLRDDGERIELAGEAKRPVDEDETAVADAVSAPPAPTAWFVRNLQADRALRVKRFQPEAGWSTDGADPTGGGHTFVQIERVHETVPGGYYPLARPQYAEAAPEELPLGPVPEQTAMPESGRNRRAVIDPGQIGAVLNDDSETANAPAFIQPGRIAVVLSDDSDPPDDGGAEYGIDLLIPIDGVSDQQWLRSQALNSPEMA